jgi:hypothetical protein
MAGNLELVLNDGSYIDCKSIRNVNQINNFMNLLDFFFKKKQIILRVF